MKWCYYRSHESSCKSKTLKFQIQWELPAPRIGIVYGSRLNIQCSQEYLRTSFHLCAAESVQNRDAHVNHELQSSAEKNDFHISNQHLSSATWGVVARSPEPKAHATNVWAFEVELEIRNVVFLGEGKTGVPGEKPLGAEKRTNNKLDQHETPSTGIEPRVTLVGGEWSNHYTIPAPI